MEWGKEELCVCGGFKIGERRRMRKGEESWRGGGGREAPYPSLTSSCLTLLMSGSYMIKYLGCCSFSTLVRL